MRSYLFRQALVVLTLLQALFVRVVTCIWPERKQEALEPGLSEQLQKADKLPLNSHTAHGLNSQHLMHQALVIILQQKCSAANQLPISMLQVSKAWRVLVLEAAAGQIDVRWSIDRVDQLSKIASLAVWLQKYGSCVCSLDITCTFVWPSDKSELLASLKPRLEAASCLVTALGSGVRDPSTASVAPWSSLLVPRIMAAFRGPSAGTNTTSGVAWSSLRTLYIDLPVDGSLLAVLPTSLTRMTISTKASSTNFVALGRLQNLRSLTLNPEDSMSMVPQSSVHQLSSLTHLTSLDVCHPSDDFDLRQVPGHLRALNLQGMQERGPGQELPIQLRHVTGLTGLTLFCHKVLDSSKLPCGLHNLSLVCLRPSAAGVLLVSLGVPGLTALTCLSLQDATGEVQALRLLAPLTQLQRLDISWSGEAHALCSVISALRVVPGGLRLSASLNIITGIYMCDVERVFQQLGSLTRLTSLLVLLPRFLDAPDAAAAEPLTIWKHMSGLTGLESFILMASRPFCFTPQDVAHSTVLTSLTYLSLRPPFKSLVL